MLSTQLLIDKEPRPDFSDLVPPGEPTYAIQWRGDAGLSGCGCGCGECQGPMGGCGCSSKSPFDHMDVVADGWDGPGGCGGSCSGAKDGCGKGCQATNTSMMRPAMEAMWGGERVLADGWQAHVSAGAFHGLGGFGPQAAMAAGAGGGAGGPDIGQWDNPDATFDPCLVPGLSLAEKVALGCIEVEVGTNLDPNPRCEPPTIQPFRDWPSRDCFWPPPLPVPDVIANYYDDTLKRDCCEAIGGLQMPSRPCDLPSQAEVDAASAMFDVDWTTEPMLVPTSGGTKDDWEDLMAHAWAMLVANLDLIEWIHCYYAGLADFDEPWPDFFACVRGRIVGVPFPVTMEAKVQGLNSNALMFTSVSGFSSIKFFPFVDPGVGKTKEGLTVPHMDAWMAAKASADVPRQICVAINLASVILHEIMHNCGESHPGSKNADCEYQWIVQSSWRAAAAERYGSCLDGTCCGLVSANGNSTRWGGATAWGNATRPGKNPNNANCIGGGSGE